MATQLWLKSEVDFTGVCLKKVRVEKEGNKCKVVYVVGEEGVHSTNSRALAEFVVKEIGERKYQRQIVAVVD